MMIDPLSFKFIDDVPDDWLKDIVSEQAYAVKLTKHDIVICLALADVKNMLPQKANMTFMDHIREFAREGGEITGEPKFFYNFKIMAQKKFKELKEKDYLCFSTRSDRHSNVIYEDLSVNKLSLKDTIQYSTAHYSELLSDPEVANEDFKAERDFLTQGYGKRKRNDVICDLGPANELMWKTTNYIKSAIVAQFCRQESPHHMPLLFGKNGFTISSTCLNSFHYTYLPISQYLREPEALFNLKLFSDIIHGETLPSKEEVEETARDLCRLRHRYRSWVGTA